MSIKYFCEVCKDELPRPDRLRRRLGDLTVEVMVRWKNTWNTGHVCDTCHHRGCPSRARRKLAAFVLISMRNLNQGEGA
jgi:hypothetical protein